MLKLSLALLCVTSALAQQQKVITANENLQQGSCGEPVNFADSSKVLVAMGVEDFGGEFKTAKCNTCVRVKGPDGEVVGTVVSKCGKRCVPGTIQISEAASKKINAKGPGQDGTFDVQWTPVPCEGQKPGPAGNQKVIAATENLQQGSCGQPVNFSGDAPLAALGFEDFGGVESNGPKCGTSVKVKGPDGEITAKVVSKCGKRCVPGTIQLSEKAAKQINKAPAGQDGTFAVTWQFE